MKTTWRRPKILTGVAVLAAALMLPVVTASPAQAAPYCESGIEVGGDIERTYLRMGGPGGALGCPLTGELVNPDQHGRRQQFEHGTVYWSASSGAFPVWGAIGDYWCRTLACERGSAGYPTSFEYTVGGEIRQNFQCAVIHFQDLGGGTSRTWHRNICD